MPTAGSDRARRFVVTPGCPVPAPFTSNVLALLAEKCIRIPVVAALTFLIARALGPLDFGRLAFAQAVLALLAPVTHLGLEQITIREMIRVPASTPALLGTTFILRLSSGLVTLALAAIALVLMKPSETLIPTLLLVASLPLTATTTVDYYFRAQQRMTPPAVARLLAFGVYVAAVLYVLASPSRVTVVAFALIIVIEQIILAALYLGLAQSTLSPRCWTVDLSTARKLWRDAWPLALSTFSIMIYMRIDQLMIKHFMGDTAVGLYSAAVTISELWYFLPLVLIQAAFPKIIALRSDSARYTAMLKKLGRLLVMCSYIFALGMAFMGHTVLNLLYGPDYADAYPALAVSAWAGVFVSLGVVQGPWSVAENLQRHALLRTIAGAVTNVILNIAFIPLWGLTGAAIATIISYGISAFSGNFFSNRTRPFFYLQLRMLVPYAR